MLKVLGTTEDLHIVMHLILVLKLNPNEGELHEVGQQREQNSQMTSTAASKYLALVRQGKLATEKGEMKFW